MWIRLGLNELGPITLVALRVLFGFLFCAVVITVKRIKWPKSFKEWFPLLLLGLTNQAIPFFLISWGQQSIDSSVAAILDATVPLFTIVMSHFILDDDKITFMKTAGLLIGFLGVIVLLSKDIGSSAGTVMGQMAVVVASIFYAGSSVMIRQKTQDTPGFIRAGVPLLSASIIMWPSAFLIESPIVLPSMGITWFALLFLGIVGSGVAFALAYYLIHEIGPTRTTMVTYLFPLGGVLLGVMVLHEQLTWQVIAGGILIVTSLLVANRQSVKNSVDTEEIVNPLPEK